jgi:hypothetical protein
LARSAAGRPGGSDAQVDAGDRHLHDQQVARVRRRPVRCQPENLALTIAAATAIAQTGISGGEAVGALVVFIVVGSLSILAPVFIYFTLGAKAAVILDELKTWMSAHNAAIMAVLLLVLGVTLIGDAIGGLS